MDLVKGYVYRIQTKTAQQRYPREHLLTYLGEDTHGTLTFNARPFAGTQVLSRSEIIKIEPVRASAGREDQGHYMNKVVR